MPDAQDRELRYWKVNCQWPVPYQCGKETRVYKKTFMVGVIARSIVEAVEIVMRDHPDAEVWAVNHLGRIDASA